MLRYYPYRNGRNRYTVAASYRGRFWRWVRAARIDTAALWDWMDSNCEAEFSD